MKSPHCRFRSSFRHVAQILAFLLLAGGRPARAQISAETCAFMTHINPNESWHALTPGLELRYATCQLPRVVADTPTMEVWPQFRNTGSRPLEYTVLFAVHPIANCGVQQYPPRPSDGEIYSGSLKPGGATDDVDMFAIYFSVPKARFGGSVYWCLNELAYADVQDGTRWIVTPADVRRSLAQAQAQDQQERAQQLQAAWRQQQDSLRHARYEAAENLRQQMNTAQEQRRQAADSAAKFDSTMGHIANELMTTDVGEGEFDGEFSFAAGGADVTVHTASGRAINGTSLLLAGGLTTLVGRRVELTFSGGYGMSADLSFLSTQSASIGSTNPAGNDVSVTYGRASAQYRFGSVAIGGFADYRSYSASDSTTSVRAGVWSYGPSIAVGTATGRSDYGYLFGFAGVGGSSTYGAGAALAVNYFSFRLEYLTQTTKGNSPIKRGNELALFAGLRLPW